MPPTIDPDPNFIDFAAKGGNSSVASARLDPSTGIVTVTFKNGDSRRYANMTSALFAEWGASNSAGHWFHNKVRQNSATFPEIDTTGNTVKELGQGSGPTSTQSLVPGATPVVSTPALSKGEPPGVATDTVHARGLDSDEKRKSTGEPPGVDLATRHAKSETLTPPNAVRPPLSKGEPPGVALDSRFTSALLNDSELARERTRQRAKEVEDRLAGKRVHNRDAQPDHLRGK